MTKQSSTNFMNIFDKSHRQVLIWCNREKLLGTLGS